MDREERKIAQDTVRAILALVSSSQAEVVTMQVIRALMVKVYDVLLVGAVAISLVAFFALPILIALIVKLITGEL